ncbi:MAG TPA: RNA polymerase sigma factor [Tepidisphaeraceae bacterium]|nr:RNA polymerase sigma factor [Tepidisphaeraceae bacterium]
MQESDTELVSKIRRGDSSAFQELVRRHADALLGMAFTLVGSRADAEDVVQETLIVALAKIQTFEGRSAVGTWLRGILVFKAAKLRRSRKVRTTLSLYDHDGSGDVDRSDAGLSTRSASAAVDSKVDAMAMLQTLSDEHREIVVLRELQQYSYEEISRMLKVPIGTVESRLYRARQELRKRFGGYNQ